MASVMLRGHNESVSVHYEDLTESVVGYVFRNSITLNRQYQDAPQKIRYYRLLFKAWQRHSIGVLELRNGCLKLRILKDV